MNLSVVIPTRNKASYLEKVLETLVPQLASQSEIIVVDDASTDATETVARRFGARYLLQHRNGFGLARARNNGARTARGDCLVFLDDDIRVCENYVQAVMDGWQRFGDRVLLAGYTWDYFSPGEEDPRTQFGVWERPGIVTQRFFHVAGGNFAVARSLYWEAGGNDERLKRGGVEDIVFGYRVSTLPNTGVVYNREMAGTHIPHPRIWGTRDERANWRQLIVTHPRLAWQFLVMGVR